MPLSARHIDPTPSSILSYVSSVREGIYRSGHAHWGQFSSDGVMSKGQFLTYSRTKSRGSWCKNSEVPVKHDCGSNFGALAAWVRILAISLA